ncbi:Protein N-terminal amidase [Beauveria bassiana]|nr:Protein N-terminal amidase [Beauveria bassiana]
MRIGCLQFAPKVGDVDNNINRADAVLSRADVEELDLLVLPELAFTGYNFKSLNQIAPYFESWGSGIASLWAQTVALKYNCTVIAGYPETVDVTPKWPTSPEYYNSAIVVSPDGETIANYRKSFLHYTDETWALEGNGFYSGFLPGIGFTSLGIGMDLNPYKFEAPWHEHEFAFHSLDVCADVIILSMAWIREESREFSCMPNEPDMETLTYWVTRLEPLIRENRKDEIIVVFANRCGIEGDVTYAGTSAVLGIHHGEVTVYGLLGRGEKELLVVDTTHPPYGKLLYHPEYLIKAGAPHACGKTPTSELDDQDYGIPEKESEPLFDAHVSDGPRQNTDSPRPRQEADLCGTSATLDRLYNGKGLATSTSQARQVEGTSNSGQVKIASSIVKLQSTAASKAIEKPRTAPIKIPESVPLDPAANAQTPREDCTRSAPIQVMQLPRAAVRPKLAIPQFPSMIPQQLYSSQPASAASAMSGESTNSIRSKDSEASVQTIRSNPRQPEDNTQYPPSGAKLTGYPELKQTYGGSVADRSEDQSFTPVAAFEDISPTSPASWAWQQSVNPFRSLYAAGAWPYDIPLEVAPEPLMWSSMGGLSRPRSRSTRRLHSNGVAPARRIIPPVTDWSKSRNQPDPHQAINEAINEWNHVSRNLGRTESDDRDAESARPASPKSRNASRSRLHERPGSAMGRLDFSAAAQHLENVVKRASSIPRLRDKQEYSETETYFDESRDNSPTKKRDTRNAIEPNDTVIRVAASPSLLDVEVQRHAMVRTPVALEYYRSALTSTQNHVTPSISSRGARVESRRLSQTQQNVYHRAPSRGRQPRPKISMTTEHDSTRRMRSTSADSTRNELLHRHVRRSSTNGGNSLGESQSRNMSNGNIPLPDGYTAKDSECSVRRNRSISANNSAGNTAGRLVSSRNRPRRRQSTSQNLLGSFDSAAPERINLPLRVVSGSERQSQPRMIPEPRFAPAPVQRPAKRNSHKVKRNSITSPLQRPSTAPLPFDPPTPKAMAFIPDAGELDSLEEDGLVLTTTIKGKFVDTQKEMGMQLPALA